MWNQNVSASAVSRWCRLATAIAVFAACTACVSVTSFTTERGPLLRTVDTGESGVTKEDLLQVNDRFEIAPVAIHRTCFERSNQYAIIRHERVMLARPGLATVGFLTLGLGVGAIALDQAWLDHGAPTVAGSIAAALGAVLASGALLWAREPGWRDVAAETVEAVPAEQRCEAVTRPRQATQPIVVRLAAGAPSETVELSAGGSLANAADELIARRLPFITLTGLLDAKPQVDVFAAQGDVSGTTSLTGRAISERTWRSASQAALTSLYGVTRLMAHTCRDGRLEGKAQLECMVSNPKGLRRGRLGAGALERSFFARETFRVSGTKPLAVRWELTGQRAQVLVSIINSDTAVVVHEALVRTGDVAGDWKGPAEAGTYVLTFSSSSEANYAATVQELAP